MKPTKQPQNLKPKPHPNDIPYRRLGGLTINQFAQLMCREYIQTRDPRALSFLQSCWPEVDWLAHIARLEHPEQLTLAE